MSWEDALFGSLCALAWIRILKIISVVPRLTAGNTYVAGCTDPTYGDSTCLGKLGFGDQEWVAIHHCGTTSSGDTNWGGCKNDPANDTALTKLANSMCDPYCSSTTLWVGGSTIEAYAVSASTAIYATLSFGY